MPTLRTELRKLAEGVRRSPRTHRAARRALEALDSLDATTIAAVSSIGIGLLFATTGYLGESGDLRALLVELAGDEVDP